MVLVLLCAAVAPHPAQADPCGMVPPVSVDGLAQSPIKRIGAQKTYVFHRGGLETFIIRPGYEGRIDEFGMLIPFPTPPAIKKAPDNFFEQLAAAIDPPEVVVDLRPFTTGFLGGGFGGGGGGVGGGLGFAVPADPQAVQVVREEAVGMYEVAVLAAGSAEALKKWMDEHKYQYPTGMDEPCEDYVEKGWCFVAVRTRVAARQPAEPRPGQREVDAKLPDGAIFDGRVQAMEFRFPSKEIVVPMRLSAFNEGETRNIVYLLNDEPSKIRGIPEEYVVRQISGDKVYAQLTQPLPVRVLGGTAKDIPAARRRMLKAERDPRPHNGVAADIFAADLLAATSGKLLNQDEHLEKELLAIGEELDLRGQHFDDAIGGMLKQQREAVRKAALAGLKDMMINIIDGEFPREVLAKDNLTFAEYEMPRARSKPEHYDAKEMGPAPQRDGRLYLGAVDFGDVSPTGEVQIAGANEPDGGRGLAALLGSLGAAALVLAAAPRRRWSRFAIALAAVVSLGVAVGAAAARGAEGGGEPAASEAVTPARLAVLLRRLDDAATARDAVKELAAAEEAALPRLVRIAVGDRDLTRRGWAIAALVRIGGEPARRCFSEIQSNRRQPKMVRLWAAAALIKTADTAGRLEQSAELLDEYPALDRPVAKSIERIFAAEGEVLDVAVLLGLAERNEKFQQSLAGFILDAGAAPLVDAALTAERSSVRNKAAGFLAALDRQGDREVGGAVAAALQFDPGREEVPWNGGPLFVPGLRWEKEDAQRLTAALIGWHAWCESKKLADEQKKINIVLGSVSLAGAAGYNALGQSGVSSRQWLAELQRALGRQRAEQLLSPDLVDYEQGKLRS